MADKRPATSVARNFLLPSAAGSKPWRLLGVFLVLALGISGLIWYAYTAEARYLRQGEYDELQALSHFKAAEIGDWLAERRWDVRLIFGSSFSRQDVRSWLERGDPLAEARLKARLESLLVNPNYVSVELLDREGMSRLAVKSPRQGSTESGSHRDALRSLLTSPADPSRPMEPRFVDLHRDLPGGAVWLAYVAPLPGSDEAGAPPVGYLWLTIDPEQTLYPLIRSWPTASPSAEISIVQREGDSVLFLNQLRHMPGAALNYRLPLNRGDLTATQAVLGREGIFEGQDYRGVEVISYLRPIPGTPWRMVTKIDREELFQGIRQIAEMAVLGAAMLLLLTGTLLWMLWRRQQLVARLDVQHQLEHIAQVSPGAIYSFSRRPDGSTAFPYASPAMRDVVGFRPEELTDDAMPVLSRVHPDDAERLWATIEASAANLSLWQGEVRYRHPEKGETWIDGKSAPTRQADGSILWQGVLTDVTGRKVGEQALAASEERYHSLFEHMFNGFALCRVRYEGDVAVDFIHLQVNPAFEEQTGLHDVEGKWISEILPGVADSDPEFLQYFGRVARSGKPERYEIYLHALDRWFSLSSFSPQPEHFVAVFENITERKQVQLALEAHRNQLETEVAARTAALVTTNKELQAFTYAASHDLKTPLRTINGFVNLLERDYRDRLEGSGLLYLDHIARGAAKMSALIEDLLAYARMEQQTQQPRSIDLGEAVDAVLAERQEEIRQGGAQVRVDLSPATVHADPQGLAQVLRNLVDNALKYSGKSNPPTIEIGGRPEDGRYRFWVRDNGIGFDMAQHDRIFGIFRRLHTDQEFPGTGIGLALVKKGMDRMGGRVWAESAPGQGSTFYLEFPAAGPSE
ncbi:MAG: cph2 [Rhodocyclaceae bacterium]|nr:cph2 [Rhodocyclaceae bacterium]